MVVPKLIKDDTKGPGRVFSIASSPNDKQKLAVIFRISESGYKQSLVRTKLRAKLEIEGPWGTMFLPEKTAKPIVFIAGGTGITPFLSIIRFASEKRLKHDIILLYASRDEKSALYFEDLKKLNKENHRLKLINTFGPIDKNFIHNNLQGQGKALFYISGPSGMIDTAIISLEELGILDSQIIFEEWSKYTFKKIPKEIIHPSTDAVIVTDLNGFFRYVNPAWQKLTQWKEKEVINQRTPRIVKSGVQDQAFYKKLWDKALAGATYRFEATNKKKDGTFYMVDEVSVPLKSRSGCIFGHSGFQHDITKIRKTEQELQELTKNLNQRVKEQTESLSNAKARDEAMLRSIGDGLVVVDGDMKTLMINHAAQRMLGFTEKESLGKVWPELVRSGTDKISLPLSQTPLAKAIKGKTTVSTVTGAVAYYYETKHGIRFPVSITAAPIILNKKTIGAIAIFRDITEEKKIERSKSEFLALASHQLRTPLTGIRWVAELLSQKEQFSEKGRQYINDINASARRLSILVDSLLDVSRIEMGRVAIKPEQVDAVLFIQNYIKQSEQAAAKKNTQIIFKEHPQKLTIVTDAVILHNIIHTFVVNSIDYTPPNGLIELFLKKKEKTFMIAVKDNGVGIPEDEQKNIFKKFSRGSNARTLQPDGNGLGLYLTYQMTKLLNGKIWFESEEGKGATFYVEIPLKVKSKAGEVQLAEKKYA